MSKKAIDRLMKKSHLFIAFLHHQKVPHHYHIYNNAGFAFLPTLL